MSALKRARRALWHTKTKLEDSRGDGSRIHRRSRGGVAAFEEAGSKLGEQRFQCVLNHIHTCFQFFLTRFDGFVNASHLFSPPIQGQSSFCGHSVQPCLREYRGRTANASAAKSVSKTNMGQEKT